MKNNGPNRDTGRIGVHFGFWILDFGFWIIHSLVRGVYYQCLGVEANLERVGSEGFAVDFKSCYNLILFS
jgi:hypothetical protein